ncbi:MAG: pseudouridine-5'-phosphate glycosidase [Anaerolineales bacterium]|nr:pseudouridine-5'-phosphate glycosidase [Anaerolineales bacterium]
MQNSHLELSADVARALNFGSPVVALESTVVTHGLPRPQNLELARDMENQIREKNATPATVALLDGKIRVGLSDAELIRLSESDSALKVSLRDFATALTKKQDGGTTVAGTMFAAHMAGVQVFATGGIGGVHKESAFDISTDMKALAEIPLIVVCAGAKSILDLPATIEYLETMGVPLVGYRADEFPAFYSRESGLKVSVRLDSAQEIAQFAQTHWGLGLRSAVLVANPIPAADAIPAAEMQPIIAQASAEAQERGIHGQAVTPYLLGRVGELTQNRTLQANLALLLNNARLAGEIAGYMTRPRKIRAV